MASFNVNIGATGQTIKALRRRFSNRRFVSTSVLKTLHPGEGELWYGLDYIAIISLTNAQYLESMETVTIISTSEGDTGSYEISVSNATERERIEFYSNPTTITDVPFASVDYDVNEKAGYSLAATGLDAISATPVANPTTWPQRILWAMQRFFCSAKTPNAITTKTDAGVDLTTQAITDDGEGTETLGAPS